MSAAPEDLDPHRDQPVEHIGPELNLAAGAVIMLHGRGASGEDILNLAQAMYHPRLAYLAPTAGGNSWYPYTFLAPRQENEPYLTSALNKVGSVVQLANGAGIPNERIVLCGFSQGACLSSEYVASHPTRYAGLIALTGGLVGPIGTSLAYAGELEQTPAFFGSGDPDPYIPWSRVEESADLLTRMNARVTIQRYPGRAHTVSAKEVAIAKQMLNEAFGAS